MNYFDPNNLNNPKNSSGGHTKIVLATIIGTISLAGGFGILGWTIIKNANWNSTPNSSRVYLEEKEINGIRLVESTFKGQGSFFGKDEDGNGKLDGIDILENMISDRLHDGPEFGALNKIEFGPSASGFIISDDVEGSYYPETRELYINTKYTNEAFPINENWSNNQNYLVERMEIMFQTFFHEYGHHIVNMHYLTNYHITPSENEKIYSGNDEEKWADGFISDFKTALNYNRSTPKYKDSFLKGNFSESEYVFPSNSSYSGYKMKSVGSIFDAAELFKRSNKKGHGVFDEALPNKNQKYGYSFAGDGFNWVSNNPLNEKNIDDLDYYYSMQELFTRKYMQLMYKYESVGRLNPDGSYKPTSVDATYGTSLLYDSLKYQNGFASEDMDYRFLHDAPFDQDRYLGNEAIMNAPDLLLDAFKKTNGSDDFSNIAIVWHKNSSKMTSASRRSIVSDPLNESKMIKFGGYFMQDEDYKFIGYHDDNNVFVPLEISVFDYSIGRKSRVGGNNWSVENNSKAYYLKNYINYSTILGRELYFSNDQEGNNIVPLVSIKNNPGYGNTSSYKSSSPDEFNKISNFPFAKNSNGKISIDVPTNIR